MTQFEVGWMIIGIAIGVAVTSLAWWIESMRIERDKLRHKVRKLEGK